MTTRAFRWYLELYDSYAHWFESRGESPNSARVAVTCALAFMALLNVTALWILLSFFGGGNSLVWIADHPWWTWMLGAGLLALHWSIGATTRPKGHEIQATGRSWAWYVGASLGFWIVTIAVALVLM